MQNTLASIGIIMVFFGIALLIAASLAGTGSTKTGGGAVIFIGPVPIAIGTDRKWALAAMVLGIVLYIALILFRGKLY